MTNDKAVKLAILEGIDHEGTTAEKIKHMQDCFCSEYGWAVERLGLQGAVREWLQGLPSAVYIPFTNHDILIFAKRTGGLAENATERQEYKILENYFTFMAAKVCQLFSGYRVPKD